MLDATGFAHLSARKPFFFHVIWNSDEGKLASTLENGLIRDETHYSGFWRSRPDHAYMGDLKYVRGLFSADAKKLKMPCDLLRVETAKLDRRKIDPDEDHFMTHDFEDAKKRNFLNGRHVCCHFRREFPPSSWLWEWAKYLSVPVPSLGEWADHVGLGEDPREALYSAQKGSIAYAGTVPPAALSFVQAGI